MCCTAQEDIDFSLATYGCRPGEYIKYASQYMRASYFCTAVPSVLHVS